MDGLRLDVSAGPCRSLGTLLPIWDLQGQS